MSKTLCVAEPHAKALKAKAMYSREENTHQLVIS